MSPNKGKQVVLIYYWGGTEVGLGVVIFGVNGWGVLVAVVIWRVHQLVREALHEQHEPRKWGCMFMEGYNGCWLALLYPMCCHFQQIETTMSCLPPCLNLSNSSMGLGGIIICFWMWGALN